MTELAPLCVSRSAFSDSRTAATIVTSGASWRTVSVVRTAESSRLTATMTARARAISASRSTESLVDVPCTVAQARGGGVLDRVVLVLDDDDVLTRDPGLPQRAHGAAALGAVAADDDVVLHASPPASDVELVPRPFGEHLDRGADEHEDEQEPHRRDEQGVGEPGAPGDRRDVAVAGRGQRDGRVVERVDDRDRAVARVLVAVALDQDDDPVDQHDGQRDRHPAGDGDRGRHGRAPRQPQLPGRLVHPAIEPHRRDGAARDAPGTAVPSWRPCRGPAWSGSPDRPRHATCMRTGRVVTTHPRALCACSQPVRGKGFPGQEHPIRCPTMDAEPPPS